MGKPLHEQTPQDARTPRSLGAVSSDDVHDLDKVYLSGYGETWAKTILIGDHSAVYGYPAIALPLQSLKMRAWVAPISGHEHMLHALGYDGELRKSGERFAGIRRAVQVAETFVGRSGLSFDIVTEADFPAERGLGSSAAAAGAVIRAVLDAYGKAASPDELFALTNGAEIITHGHPSGLDSVTTCASDPILLDHGAISTVVMNIPAYLVIADSGISGSTRDAVGGVRERYEHEHERTRTILESLGSLGELAVADLAHGDIKGLGAHMNQAQDMLAQLQVSHPTLDSLVDAARSAGAVGAKLTGGGLGGCMIALASSRRQAESIQGRLYDHGAKGVWVHALQTGRSSGNRDEERYASARTRSDESIA
ncbi:MAG: mevalonate kinase [Bifidobacterium psychraerophilum]|uniref:mevalonate kinase n=1 Tax=Bifidobacterium psychraerophilum TaxID=218140 RepID=UPI0039E92717